MTVFSETMGGLESGGSAFQSFTGGLQDLFGSGSSMQGSGQSHQKGQARTSFNQHNRGSKRLQISDEAIQKIIQDMLSETDGGLAAIFGGEKASGLYNSSVAAEEAGDLAAKILGEVGKLRATEKYDDRTSGAQAQNQVNLTRQEQTQDVDQQGLLDGLF